MTGPLAISAAFLRAQEDSLRDDESDYFTPRRIVAAARNEERPGPVAAGPGANSRQEEHTP